MTWTLAFLICLAAAAFFMAKQLRFVRPSKARILLRQRGMVVDVRTEAEYRRGHLPGSINLPLSSLCEELPKRAPNKQQVVLAYCGSGARSGVACRMLREMGYEKVFNMGGYRRAAHILRGSI